MNHELTYKFNHTFAKSSKDRMRGLTYVEHMVSVCVTYMVTLADR